MTNNQPIGVLDSGIGGLTVLKQLMQQLPNEKYIFIGDQKRLPYGAKAKQEVIDCTRELVQFFIEKNAKLIVYACNTATAQAMETLQKEFDIPMIGVIQSGSEEAVKQTQQKVGVIATVGTIDSRSYEEKIKQLNPDLTVYAKATPDFVPMIENNQIDTTLIAENLHYFDDKNIESLVLGCTHYPIIAQQIDDYFGGRVKIIDPSLQTAVTTLNYLTENNMLGNNSEPADFYTTDDPQRFNQAIEMILNLKQVNSMKVNVEK
ncbi:glutamate racemase [Lactobacillus sp. YT155]|uniref:glutamate racemase n=1 Tax=Lactobacillus sp. YT155 TaxID=3060955 RepID=UPI0026603106|nr:glutamate racemase [Lactobacillus sp. YT155]MDO1605918.1 glutamate racemase [Lactobacillus sp. YT155]